MACWRPLDLSEDEHVPELLIKPQFDQHAYTVFLTDLGNIWSERLDLDGILERASLQPSPIEVNKQDNAQLGILLDHIQKSLSNTDDSSRRIMRYGADGIVLHTTCTLPEPLDSLRWEFRMEKRTSVVLKNELILPLLVSSHIQHERINRLIAMVNDKDKAIGRLADQFESSNLDLATAFPSLGGSKSGRRLIKREQAAKHVPGLQPFREDAWKQNTSKLQDGHLTSLELFEEALSECIPVVPSELKSQTDDHWWTSISASLGAFPPPARTKSNRSKPPAATALADDDIDNETEDEFETHENAHLRITTRNSSQPSKAGQQPLEDDQDLTEDSSTNDFDLDAPPTRQSQSRSQSQTILRKGTSSQPSPKLKLSPSPKKPSSHVTPKPKGFRIGGTKPKPKKDSPSPQGASTLGVVSSEVVSAEEDNEASAPAHANAGGDTHPKLKPSRKPFKIGGKHKISAQKDKESLAATGLASTNLDDGTSSTDPSGAECTDHIAPTSGGGEDDPLEDEHEETAEEKAERKRRELKRKNEALAKKQAHRKRKRF